MYALVDGNNFFVSCERVFRPDLRGRPVVVLSNNDGCAIARSNEAKALGIRMGAPWFQIRHLADTQGLVALSANFALYGDLSDRMMGLAAGLGPGQEVYSIDECFIDLAGVRGDLVARAHAIRARILQWVGIPCGIGIGPTKTLAKLANHVAKTTARHPGSYPAQLPPMAQVCNLAALAPADLAAVLAATAVRDVWGVGRRIGAQLEKNGITNAWQLARLDPAWVRARWSVVLESTVRELQGTACFTLDAAPSHRQQVAYTRSFGQPVSSLGEVQQAVTEFASRAAEKLRTQRSLAGQVLVYIRTSPFRQEPQYSNSTVRPLPRPSADTTVLVGAALAGLQAIYRPGFQLAKAGVLLLELQPDPQQQAELPLHTQAAPVDRSRLMLALDGLNQRYGRGTVLLASAGLGGAQRSWVMKQARRSPAYTTCWADVPVAR